MDFLMVPTMYDFGMNQEDLVDFTESRQLVWWLWQQSPL